MHKIFPIHAVPEFVGSAPRWWNRRGIMCLSVLVGVLTPGLPVVGPSHLAGQSPDLRGQLQVWTVLKTDGPAVAQLAGRYIPELTGGLELDNGMLLDGLGSVDLVAGGTFSEDEPWDGRLGVYRLWGRLSTDQFEARVGRQHINFGSALLLRPLRWFDQIDPRDPLQITDGVNAMLLRYYFVNNANLWIWGLYGNDEAKGNELVPTRDGGLEVGGRAQVPVPRGEVALSYHYRRADFSAVVQPGSESDLPSSLGQSVVGGALALGLSSDVPEYRIGFDGKWDVEVGLWFEGALYRRDDVPDALRYQNQLSVGTDYTFGLGNGLTMLVEHLMTGISERASSTVDNNVSGALLSYPVGLLDRLSAIVSYEWENHDWYRTVTWDRQYDNWRFVALGFWNPDEAATLTPGVETSTVFTGLGVQLQGVYNH